MGVYGANALHGFIVDSITPPTRNKPLATYMLAFFEHICESYNAIVPPMERGTSDTIHNPCTT